MTYDLDQLGWVDFEELVQTLLIAKLGLGVESWGGSGDWGRDAYFSGSLKYPTKSLSKGPFLFQCKFVVAANAAGAKPSASLINAVNAECARIGARMKGLRSLKWRVPPKHYILISNAPVSPGIRIKLTDMIAAVLPLTEVHIHSGQDICNWLNLTPSIVTRFPQLFTIRQLTDFLRETVNSGIISRSEIAISMAREDAKIFVPTSAYFEARERLTKYFFCVLEGPPEMGKTTIARLIALAQLTQGWDAIECKGPKEFHKSYKGSQPQVFVADDFFGRTDYEPTRVSKWQEELPYILRRLDAKHWLILTSRAHLLKMGKSELDISGHNSRFPELGEVVVNAGKLSKLEKGRILYRHAKVARLSAATKNEIKANLRLIIGHQHFTPLRIKNLVASLTA